MNSVYIMTHYRSIARTSDNGGFEIELRSGRKSREFPYIIVVTDITESDTDIVEIHYFKYWDSANDLYDDILTKMKDHGPQL